jgi:phenylpyruvate tautomerase PptA (4-oxalocrotonate tautomerase family)
MPLVRIDVSEHWSASDLEAIGDAVQTALVETLDVPTRDRFQVVTQHNRSTLIVNRNYLDVDRSDAVVVVQVILSSGRATEAKRRFYARLADLLHTTIAMRPEDLSVVLVENHREDWSFGRGEASYLVLPPEQWK